MKYINVKLRLRKNVCKYRKVTTTNDSIYGTLAEIIESSYEYSPDATLQKGEWFLLKNASQQSYAIDLLQRNFQSVDFDGFKRTDFYNIDFLFVFDNDLIYFQNIGKSKLVEKKAVINLGDEYRYRNDTNEIVINEFPDAIYCKTTDILYFRRLEAITGIFKGISELYREATEEETSQFLQNDFIALKEGYDVSSVKTANRKRIALAMNTLSKLNDEDKSNIFDYIGDYCPDLKTSENTFAIGSEEELKMLLFGIEQRFYTTLVGGEKRLANSVIPMN